MFSNNLLSFLLLALAAAHASPLGRDTGKTTLKFSTNMNTAGFSNLVEKDRARVKALAQLSDINGRSASRRSVSVSVTNAAVTYSADVGVGNPPTIYTLIIDTGSSNTWIGANKTYAPSGSSVDTGNVICVTYGSGSFCGEEWLDIVTLSSGLVISQQSIGVASDAYGFNDIDGILGLGPVDLTKGTVRNTDTVPTVMNNLYSQGSITEQVLGVFFAPTSESNNGGELTFGGYDSSMTASPVEYVALTTTSPSSNYWGIVQSISYGGTTILSSATGIVDTGTTLIYITTSAFLLYRTLTGGIPDPITGLLTITPSEYANLKPLSFVIGSTSYDLTPNAQIWPRSLNSAIGGTSGSIYLVLADIGLENEAIDFINGYCFLQRFYSIYDTNNQRMGLAKTRYTNSTTN